MSDAPPSSQGARFVRFALIGAVGFPVDAGIVELATERAALSPYLARILSFAAAATVTWWLNRRFNFPGARRGPALGQWARFMAANSAGACVNYAVFGICIAALPALPHAALLGVALGSAGGLAVNFLGSTRLVFAARAAGPDGSARR